MRTLLFITVCILLQSCSVDLLNDNCGENELVGEFQLLESSLSFFSHDQNDVELRYEDQDGIEHIFTQNKFESKNDDFDIIKMLCHESLSDESYEYYNHQSKLIEYTSQFGDKIKFHLYTESEGEENINRITVFDRINMSAHIDFLGSWTQTGIVTGYHQNGPLDEESKFIRGSAVMVSDTVINNYQYQNVYEKRSFNDRSIFYTKKDGMFLISNPDGNFLRLKK